MGRRNKVRSAGRQKGKHLKRRKGWHRGEVAAARFERAIRRIESVGKEAP